MGDSAQFQGRVDLTENLSSGANSTVNATYGGITFGADEEDMQGVVDSALVKTLLVVAGLVAVALIATRKK